MKEIVRIEKGYFGNELRHYNFSIYEGEVVYIQSLSEQSIKILSGILSGNQKLEKGKLFISEKEIADYGVDTARAEGIYTVTFGNEFYSEASIAQNLEPLKPFYKLFSKQKINSHIQKYMREENMDFEPETPVWQLDDMDKKCLGVLKAKLYHARLVIIDLRNEIFEGIGVEKLGGMIRKLNTEGITFLILSSSYSSLSCLAGRIQYLHQGRALKEWENPSESVMEKLRCVNFFQSTAAAGYEKRLIGIYDYEIDLGSSFWNFLKLVKENNREIWEKYIPISLPADGEAFSQGTVIIPRNSQNLLLKDLTIGENLTIAAKERISHGKEGVIIKRLEKRVVESFYREHEIPNEAMYVEQLSNLQRKILSIARWELTKPKTIVLELPYQSVGSTDSPYLRDYLFRLAQKGIRIIYFSKVIENMQEDCNLIIQTHNGCSAKTDTF